MKFRRYSLFSLLFISIGAFSAIAAENVQPPVEAPRRPEKTKPSVKASEHIDKTKTKTKAKTTETTKPPVVEGNMRDPIFSDPGVPVMSSAKPPKSDPSGSAPSAAKDASPPPGSGPSLALKWHASSDNDPFDLGRNTLGPDPGNKVLGGIKLGF
jgi:hypothetical protein